MLSALCLVLATFADAHTATSLVVSDPSLLIDSLSTSILPGALGNQLDFTLASEPSGVAFLVFSPTPPFGAGSLGGTPIEVDLANLGYLVQGVLLDAGGHLIESVIIPDWLSAGTSIWTQAAVLTPSDLAVHLSGGVRIDLVLAEPADLPLLSLGRHAGVDFTSSTSTATLDTAYFESLSHGADAYTLHVGWNELEIAPGVLNFHQLTADLQLLSATGHEVLVVLETINGLRLELPSDLLDPADPSHLAPGITWGSQALNSRFEFLLDLVSPLLADNQGFFLSVGNEVDLFLDDHPEQLSGYAVFVAHARDHVHATQPKLGVGVTLTAKGALGPGPVLQQMTSASDLLAFTYYPLAPGFSAADPAVPLTDLPMLSALVAPFPLLLQEVGYGSGAESNPVGGASLEKQRLFLENVFTVLATLPKPRFTVVASLTDLDTKQLEELAIAHDNHNPKFLENRGTIGLFAGPLGTPKPAWAAYLAGLDGL